jgi:transposase
MRQCITPSARKRIALVEVGGSEIKTLAIDHHGLIAATCKDLKIAERIDKVLYSDDTGPNVTPGESVVAMIINGLGFTNRRLYLMPQFFENKPVEKLIAEGLTPEDITYDTLAATLDDIWEYGESKLYGEVALDIALDNKFLGTLNHLDTTSVSVQGDYNVPDEPGVVKLTHGHSKDHRPDLKQLLISLVVTGDSRFPLWMEALDGNSSDKVNFHETLGRVKTFQEQMKYQSTAKWVADSALYTKEKLSKTEDYLWLTRVPETLTEAQRLVTKASDSIVWTDRGKGYKTARYSSQYGNVNQRWLLVHSDQGYKREMATFEKRLTRQEEKYQIEASKLSRQLFGCEQDAAKALEKFGKGKRHFEIIGDVNAVTKYAEKGRPKAGAEKIIVGYKIDVTVARDTDAITQESYKNGRFILATNDLNIPDYPDATMLSDYKSQQDVESGFDF